jgi:hypothetical protein
MIITEEPSHSLAYKRDRNSMIITEEPSHSLAYKRDRNSVILEISRKSLKTELVVQYVTAANMLANITETTQIQATWDPGPGTQKPRDRFEAN